MRLGEQDIILQAGDAVLLPHGAGHQMLDSLVTAPEPGPQVMQRLMTEEVGEPAPNSTRMLCGHFEWDGEFDHPLFKELPELIVVRGVFESQDAVRFRTIVDLITTESTDNDPGSAAIADRMGEVLLVSMLKSWMVENKPGQGVLATINDPRLHCHNVCSHGARHPCGCKNLA